MDSLKSTVSLRSGIGTCVQSSCTVLGPSNQASPFGQEKAGRSVPFRGGVESVDVGGILAGELVVVARLRLGLPSVRPPFVIVYHPDRLPQLGQERGCM